MGNNAANMVLDTKWTPEAVSTFTINLKEQQVKIIFGKHKSVTGQNLNALLQETVILYLLNKNVKAVKGVKVDDVKRKLEAWRKGGNELANAIDPVEKYIVENEMKDQQIDMIDFPSLNGTWVQKYKSTMDTL